MDDCATSCLKTILLIDDDDAFRDFAHVALAELGHFRVVLAASGAAALEILADDHAINLILLDIVMPDLDGFETLRAIRFLPEAGLIPVVFISASDWSNEQHRTMLASGARGVVKKPTDGPSEPPRYFERPFCLSQAAAFAPS